jgi:murein DD-endopeptidase MepM/ murein hydrolase activator NlpD
MDQNLVLQSISSFSSFDTISDQRLNSEPPLGEVFQQLLVSLLLATSFSNIRSTSSHGEGIFSPTLMSVLDRISSTQGLSGLQNSYQTPQYTANKPHLAPVNGVLTQGYHKGHIGVDTGIPIGTPIKSTMDGKVAYAGWNNEGYGNLVIIQNGDYKTYYAHLSAIPVNVGDFVNSGTIIGLSGSTGNSTGPHLHYEVRINDKPVDPANFNGLPATAKNLSA